MRALMVILPTLMLMACEGPEGPTGPSGEQGPTGEEGPTGR